MPQHSKQRWFASENQTEGGDNLSERDGYRIGVPCWVAAVLPDPERAVAFYTELFGWEARETMGAGSPGKSFICTLRGRDVAAIGSERDGDAPSVPAWRTYMWVESADNTVARVRRAGGSVVMEPFDLLDAARAAVVSDAAGAEFGVWQPGEHKGAGIVNEPGAWSMSQLNTHDPDGSKAFYGAVFGWVTDTFDTGEGEVTMWRLPGYVGGEPEQPVSREVVAVMAPMTGDRSPDVPPHWSIDFWVYDVDATADRAAKLGGRIVTPPFQTSVGTTAVLADPQGAEFSVSKVGPGA